MIPIINGIETDLLRTLPLSIIFSPLRALQSASTVYTYNKSCHPLFPFSPSPFCNFPYIQRSKKELLLPPSGAATGESWPSKILALFKLVTHTDLFLLYFPFHVLFRYHLLTITSMSSFTFLLLSSYQLSLSLSLHRIPSVIAEAWRPPCIKFITWWFFFSFFIITVGKKLFFPSFAIDGMWEF